MNNSSEGTFGDSFASDNEKNRVTKFQIDRFKIGAINLNLTFRNLH